MLSVSGQNTLSSNRDLGMTKKEFSENNRGSRVSWCRLKFPVKGSSRYESAWDWHAHPSGDVKMIQVLRDYTSINLKQEWNVADIEDLDKMCHFPLVFMHGQRLINLNRKSAENLREYVLRGGFLLIDDCVYKKYTYPDLFFLSMITTLKQLFPGVKLEKLKTDHKLFNCYFKLKSWPHMQGRNNGIYAAYYKKRLIAFLYSSDLHCGWVNVGWFSRTQTRSAYKMGVNLYVYAMNN
jgi:hypothetical protein